MRAYKANFGYIDIVKEDYGKGFYVFTDETRKKQGNWTQYCYNIDYLNGILKELGYTYEVKTRFVESPRIINLKNIKMLKSIFGDDIIVE